MKTFILATLLALTATSGVIAATQPAAANPRGAADYFPTGYLPLKNAAAGTPVRPTERVRPYQPPSNVFRPNPIKDCAWCRLNAKRNERR